MKNSRLYSLSAVLVTFSLAAITGCLSDSAPPTPTSTPAPAPTPATPPTSTETLTRTIEDGGTGPFKAILVGDSTLPTHTIFRPRDLSVFGAQKKLPLLSWGNGACANNTDEHQNFLSEIASHGYLIIGIGPAQAAAGRGAAGSGTTSRQLLEAIDWAIAQNSSKSSIYYDKIDTSRIAVAGMSCGGLQALEVSPDPRITTTLICNSGIFSNSASAPAGAARGGPTPGARGPAGGGAIAGMPPLTKDHLAKLHAPILYILGGTTDIAYNNGMDDFHRIEKLPAFAANMDTGHGGTYGRPHGGAYAPVALAWLDWNLKGDPQAAKMFTGNPAGLSQSTLWKVEKKNLP